MDDRMKNTETPTVICGAGLGGVAAALALLRTGSSVILLEETPWIGGQLTSQAVPPDEHGWIERFGCTRSYREFRERVRAWYFENYPVLEHLRGAARFNPGNGWVSPLCHEPRVALAVLEAMLAPYWSSGRLQVRRNCRVVAVRTEQGRRVRAVVVRNLRDGQEEEYDAAYFLDATENGDLLPLADMDHVTGRESRQLTGEPGASEEAEPENIQAFSFCFMMEHLDGENFIGPKPVQYEFWRDYVPKLNPPWPGRLLSWDGLNPRTMERMHYHFDPHREKPGPFSGLWAFRRMVDRGQFEPGFFRSDLCLVNWPMLDYLEGNLLTGSEEERKQHLENARQLSLSLFHWLQIEAPRPDGGQGWPGLRLRPDLLGTQDGLAMAPYIREARRIRALHTIVEKEVSAQFRPGESLAERYADSVGIGYYRIDLHPSTGGDNYIDVPSLPFRIPLGALIPVKMENLLPASKNIGTTHLTNGCYRLHPVEWNIGESAGLLLHFCIENGCLPAEVHGKPRLLRRFQALLKDQGVELEWPENLNLDEGDPHAHACES